jgi:hypothetical protein
MPFIKESMLMFSFLGQLGVGIVGRGKGEESQWENKK